jgi:hypothetical protein
MKEKEEMVKDRKEEKKEGEEIKTQNKTQNKTQKDLVQMSKSYSYSIMTNTQKHDAFDSNEYIII